MSPVFPTKNPYTPPSFSIPSARYAANKSKIIKEEEEYSRKMTYGELSREHKERIKDRIERYWLKGATGKDMVINIDKLLNFDLPLNEIQTEAQSQEATKLWNEIKAIKENKKKWPKWIGILISIGSVLLAIFIISLSIYGLGPMITSWAQKQNFLLAILTRLSFMAGTAGLSVWIVIGGVRIVAKKCKSIL